LPSPRVFATYEAVWLRYTRLIVGVTILEKGNAQCKSLWKLVDAISLNMGPFFEDGFNKI